VAILAVPAAQFTTGPTDGVLVYGVFLEGARWDRDKRELGESLPKMLYDPVPVMQLIPVDKANKTQKLIYVAPLYKTSARRGMLSTTGHSTNYVMAVDLLSNAPPAHWINRGTALLCMLDD